MSDATTIEAAALADNSADVCRISIALDRRDQEIRRLRRALDEIRLGIELNRDSRLETSRLAKEALAEPIAEAETTGGKHD